MLIEVVNTDSGLDALQEEWNALLENSASRVPFLRHEYLSAWWKGRGGDEWPQAVLHVLTGRDNTGTLTGIAPLFVTPDRLGIASLMLLGSIEISDYLDLICRPEDLPAFCDALLLHLSGRDAPNWSRLDFYNILETSPTIDNLQAAATVHGWEVDREMLQPCPYISLPGDWEAYLAGIDKKQRHEIRRKMRRAGDHPGEVRWYIVHDPEALEEEMEHFLRLMAYDPVKVVFLTNRMREQMKAIMRAFFKAGMLQLAFIEVGGEKAAAYLNLDFDGRIWVYNSGFNPELRDLSPGWVLLSYLLQWANEHQRSSFDFLRGSEDYKYRFGAVDRHILRITIRC